MQSHRSGESSSDLLSVETTKMLYFLDVSWRDLGLVISFVVSVYIDISVGALVLVTISDLSVFTYK
jgi:hypothetical protein